jgi:hypothetical protein
MKRREIALAEQVAVADTRLKAAAATHVSII